MCYNLGMTDRVAALIREFLQERRETSREIQVQIDRLRRELEEMRERLKGAARG